jgi:VIT1/CCC1 family predicted Fe2+/Mn2+ transporter
VAHEVSVERDEIRRHPAAEQAELAAMYQEMGLSADTAQAVARDVHRNPDLAVRVHITQELGVDPEESPSPWTAAISSFLCFSVGGVIPLIPFLFGASALWTGLAVGAVGLLVLGALTARFTRRPWLLAGLRQLAFGALAAGATYLVGLLIGVGVSG